MKLKHYINSALFLVLFIAIGAFCKSRTDKFTVQAVRSSRPFNPMWEGHPLTPQESLEVEQAMGESYTYYGCGGQSYIFFSDSDRYVLKLFKQKNFTYPVWLSYLPVPYLLDRYKEKKRWKRDDKLFRDFSSYKTAFDDLQPFTGVIYIHLNPTSHLNRAITITDNLGIQHQIDLDRFDFILQKKAEYVYDRINDAVRDGDIEKAKRATAQVIHFIVNRCKLGYHDRDPNIRTNCGFIGEDMVKIDVGRLVYREEIKEPKVYLNELAKITAPFKAWLQDEHPVLFAHFEEEMDKVSKL